MPRRRDDFLPIDWFELAPLALEAARQRFGVGPKSPEAIAAGSAGPWEPGGISPYQARTGQTLAGRRGIPYDSYGASTR